MNYPQHAIKVKFKPLTGPSHNYFIWKADNGKWNWCGLGNGGVEDTQELAMKAGRTWLSLGTTSLPGGRAEGGGRYNSATYNLRGTPRQSGAHL